MRIKPYIDEIFDIKECLRSGNKAYKNGDYTTCIDAFKQVLSFDNPKPFVYAKLGLSYRKLRDIDTAIDYLTVATELSGLEDAKFDFTDLIYHLKGYYNRIKEEERKPYFKMEIFKFDDDMSDYYDIEKAEEVAEQISAGMSIDDACLNVGLDEEQKSIITLIFARDYYTQENYTMGDTFLKKVERTKNKSKFTNSLLEEIRKNKKFYKNRVRENQKCLLLTTKVK